MGSGYVFPSGNTEALKSALPDTQWVDPALVSAAGWLQILKLIRPKVIISGWRTPRLPAVMEDFCYLAHVTGPVSGVLPRKLLEKGVQVTNWGAFAAPFVAEHALLRGWHYSWCKPVVSIGRIS